jgi:hypothetical protein
MYIHDVLLPTQADSEGATLSLEQSDRLLDSHCDYLHNVNELLETSIDYVLYG